MQPAKKVICQKKMKQTANALYIQNMRTDGNGLKIPIQKDTISVTEVIVIDTAASDNIKPIRSGTLSFMEVRRQAANITNVSSIPIPRKCFFLYLFSELVNFSFVIHIVIKSIGFHKNYKLQQELHIVVMEMEYYYYFLCLNFV